MEKYSDNIRARFTARHQKCLDLAGEVKNKRVLNVGCYNGWFEQGMVKKGAKEIIGIDIEQKFIELSKKNVPQANFFKKSILEVDLSKNYFDLITMFDVLEHLPVGKEKEALKKIRQVLRPLGLLLLSVPNGHCLSKFFDPAWYFGHRHYSRKKLINLLKRNGFKIIALEIRGGCFELITMFLLYFCKWLLRREIPFKNWFENKRKQEYFSKNGFVTIFIKAIKQK